MCKEKHSDYVWVLDPIDGTKSFITGILCQFSFEIDVVVKFQDSPSLLYLQESHYLAHSQLFCTRVSRYESIVTHVNLMCADYTVQYLHLTVLFAQYPLMLSFIRVISLYNITLQLLFRCCHFSSTHSYVYFHMIIVGICRFWV